MATTGNIHHWEIGANGKGSRQRQCDRESIKNFNDNFDRIFGKKKGVKTPLAGHKPENG